MISKTITYNDYNGVERTETFWFNLTEAEIIDMELGTEGGFADMIYKIIDAKNVPSLIKIFKEIVLKAYGEKTADGRRFRKVDDNGRPLNIAFTETEAYSIIYMELVRDADEAAKFVNGILPANAAKNATAPVAVN